MAQKSWPDEALDLMKSSKTPDHVELILPARLIPSNTDVRKVRGSTYYELVREVRIFGDPKQGVEGQTIKAQEGIVFLQSDRGVFNAYRDTTRFVMRLSLPMAETYIELLANHRDYGK